MLSRRSLTTSAEDEVSVSLASFSTDVSSVDVFFKLSLFSDGASEDAGEGVLSLPEFSDEAREDLNKKYPMVRFQE